MNVLLYSFIIFGALCTVAMLALLAYRMKLTYHEDTSIHTNLAESSMATHQDLVAHQLQWIDRLGPILTVLVVVYALVLTFFYIYVPWAQARLSA